MNLYFYEVALIPNLDLKVDLTEYTSVFEKLLFSLNQNLQNYLQ